MSGDWETLRPVKKHIEHVLLGSSRRILEGTTLRFVEALGAFFTKGSYHICLYVHFGVRCGPGGEQALNRTRQC